MNFSAIGAAFSVFRAGSKVADPVLWKKGQITVTALAPVILAAGGFADALGWKMPLSQDQAVAIAGGIVAVVNIVCTIVSTDKLGIGDPAKSVGGAGELRARSTSDSGQTSPGIDSVDTPPTRASQGYERVGPSAGDRAGG